MLRENVHMLKEKYQPHVDKFGLCHPKAGTISQNGIRFTTEMAMALKLNHELTPKIRVQLENAILSCEMEPGLFRRHPTEWRQDQIGPDDYVYLGLFSAAIELNSGSIARRVVQYGRDHWWTFNNLQPGRFSKSAFLGRQQQLVCHLELCAGLESNWFRRAWLSQVFKIAARSEKDDQDAWCLTWAIDRSLEALQTQRLAKSRATWKAAYKRVWPEGYGALLRDYFAHDHPSCDALRGF